MFHRGARRAEAELTEIKGSSEGSSKDLQKSEKARKKAEEELATLRAQNTAYTKQKVALEQQVTKLEKDYKAAKLKLEETESALGEADAEKKKQTKAVQEARAAATTAEETLAKLQREFDENKTQLAALKKKVALLMDA